MSVSVSVVVPTCRRPELLTRCLTALLAQRFNSLAYEVIVADDAADPEIAALVERLAGAMDCGPSVRYLAVRGAHGPAAARNAGWRQALGPIIAFTDDDCIPDLGWLRAGVAVMVEGVVGVSGRLVVPCAERPTDYERNASLLAGAEFATANCFYRRDILEAVGGLDERFQAAWREDSDLAFTLLARGARLGAAPDAVVVHPIRSAQWGVSIGQQRRSMYNALLYKKHPRLYRERIQSSPPWRYYLIAGALLVGLGGLGARRPTRAAVGLALWAALTMRFCQQRLEGASTEPAHVAEMAVTSIIIPPVCIFWRLRGALRFRTLFL
ncbi:MAG TPA: glycosyltransferase [Ktedonobacterales bacterium]|jgi:GT2 family glycosyltransferase|nr:glycosyltransferase [Ktedonobacterales bacterium]